jgi:hypothetical protein
VGPAAEDARAPRAIRCQGKPLLATAIALYDPGSGVALATVVGVLVDAALVRARRSAGVR